MIKKIIFSFPFILWGVPLWAAENSIIVTPNHFNHPVISSLAAVDRITKEQITTRQLNSVIEAITLLPGIDASQYGGRGQLAQVYVRGTKASHVLVLIDGIPLSTTDMSGAVDFSQIPLALVQRIEYIRGAHSAIYGSGAIGGVINIITYKEQSGIDVDMMLGSNDDQNYSATSQQHLDSIRVSLAGGYNKTKGFNVYPNSTINEDKDRDGFENRSLLGMIEHKINDNFSTFFRGYGYANRTNYDMIYPYSSNKRHYYSYHYDAGFNYQQENSKSQWLINYQKDKDYNFSTDFGPYGLLSSVNNIEQLGIRLNNQLEFSSVTVNFGLDWQRERVDRINKKQINYNKGGYIALFRNVKGFLFESAFRLDDYSQFDWYPSWQIGTGWELTPQLRFLLSYATAFKTPTTAQQYGTMWTIANPDLKPEKSQQWELGLQGVFANASWRIAAYRNSLRDNISYDINRYINLDRTLIKGIEGDIAFVIGHYSHLFSAEYIDSRDRKTYKRLLRHPYKKFSYQLDANFDDINAFISYNYYSKRQDITDNGNRLTLNHYQVIDIGASYSINPNVIIRAKIGNLLNENYQTVNGYATAGREWAFTTSFSF